MQLFLLFFLFYVVLIYALRFLIIDYDYQNSSRITHPSGLRYCRKLKKV